MTRATPPTEADELAAWFAEGVRAELAALEKKGGERRYELHAGHRVTPEESRHAIYRFTLADSTLLPGDASGTIEVGGRQFKATVVGQDANRLDVQIDGAEGLGAFVARAILRIDDLALLRKLAEMLDAIASGAEPASALATAIFHPKPDGACRQPLPPTPALDCVEGEQRDVLEQASASEITFVWGPPGTGKTYVIAHLMAALVARGERVLMASHTHAAVDQSIREAVKRADPPGSSRAGPLADSEWLGDDEVVRIGDVPPDSKVPKSVRLDDIVERKAQGIRSEIGELQRRAGPLSAECARLNTKLAEWERLSELQTRLAETERRVGRAAALVDREAAEKARARALHEETWQQLDKVRRAWLFRGWRVAKAERALAAAQLGFEKAAGAVQDAGAALRNEQARLESFQIEAEAQAAACGNLPTADALEQQLIPLEAELDELEQGLTNLKERLDSLERDVISGARVVAATLTKCYVGDELDGQLFDALIVDEISMALPPLLFVAALRATQRVILVGDFKQLPPIIRGDTREAGEEVRKFIRERLGTDAFHLAGVARELEPTKHPALARLREQRRMVPAIADAARRIYYRPRGLKDHEKVRKKKLPDWLAFLPANPLVVVDTADLHCWCGRQAGSLSRFNLYSAQIAVELAAMAAAGITEQADAEVRPIGIVTPYTAQARLLQKLVQTLRLDGRVRFGTVHALQGGEAELIIFDCALDEPYWTARLCNPKEWKEVRRDLNVALTRAQSKFVLVGSSEWLNRRAKPRSGLGELWEDLKKHADLVSAVELVEHGFAGRVAQASSTNCGPGGGVAGAHAPLDENEFFDVFATDLREADKSIFGLVPFFGQYRWPKVEPLIREALERGVEVTFVTPPPSEAKNKSYCETVIRSLRQLGAVVVASTGLHGKDIVIDSRIHYTGSLNWASHRGRAEIMHRNENPEYARTVLEYLQARHIRASVRYGNEPRTCPNGHPVHVVNQAKTMRPWDRQPMKLGCADYQSTGCKYLVDIDQRAPFLEPPLCSVDGRTKYRRVKRGRGEVWECPKHPKECERFKVVMGDP